MYENMLIVENCFYFSHNNNNNNNKNFLSFYSSLKNFILINNSEKINVYEDIDFILNYPYPSSASQETNYLAAAVNSLSTSAKSYFFDNSFAAVFIFTKLQMNLIYQYPKLRAVFSFDKLSEEAVMRSLRMFAAQRKNLENYNVMLFDLENSKDFEEEEKMYLYFTRVPGVHFTDKSFENISHFNMESLDIAKLNEFADDNYSNFKNMIESQHHSNSSLDVKSDFIDAEKDVKSKKGGKASNANSAGKSGGNNASANAKGNFAVEKKFVTAKIVEKLDQIKYDENNSNGVDWSSEKDVKNNSSINNKKDKDIYSYNSNNNHEKNMLAEEFVKGKDKDINQELNKKIGSALISDNNNINNDIKNIHNLGDSKENSIEDHKKHENGFNKIIILFVYFVVYSAIYLFFYLKISKRDESKYN